MRVISTMVNKGFGHTVSGYKKQGWNHELPWYRKINRLIAERLVNCGHLPPPESSSKIIFKHNF